MNEIEIIEKVQNGNIDALGDLFEIYKNQSLKMAYLITGNLHTSEDIVQEAFIKCFYKVKDLKQPEFFKAWFFKVLTRTAWQYSNKDKKSVPIEEIYEKSNENSFSKSLNAFILNEEKSILREEIQKLEIKHKTILILYYFNGFSVKEISKIMGCFEGTVKSRLHSARKILKKRLIDIEYLNLVEECENNEMYKLS